MKLRYESLGSACVALGASHLATSRLRFGRRRHGSRMRPCGFHGYAPCPALGRPRSTASRARSSLAAAAAERPSLTASVRLGDDLRRRVPSRFGPRSCGSRAVAPAPLVQRFAYRRAAALLQPWFVCRFHGNAWTCPLEPPSPLSLPFCRCLCRRRPRASRAFRSRPRRHSHLWIHPCPRESVPSSEDAELRPLPVCTLVHRLGESVLQWAGGSTSPVLNLIHSLIAL